MPEQSIILRYDKDENFVEVFEDPSRSPEEQRKMFGSIRAGLVPPPEVLNPGDTLVRVRWNSGDNINTQRWTVPANAQPKPPITKKDKSK